MKKRNYPNVSAYTIPKKNVLVISCIDLRLTDNLVDFLHHDNLENRYDHFILAGSSLLCSGEEDKFSKEEDPPPYSLYHVSWTNALVDHVDIALSLHSIEDVYIVEHQDCGAYKYFLKNYEEGNHQTFARELAKHLGEVAFYKRDQKDKWYKHYLTVTCFFIDLRGNVKVLNRTDPKEPTKIDNPPEGYLFRTELARQLKLPPRVAETKKITAKRKVKSVHESRDDKTLLKNAGILPDDYSTDIED